MIDDEHDARISELVNAMRAFRAEWQCDQLSVAYVTTDGELHTLVVGREYAYVESDNGRTTLIGPGWN